MLNKTNKVKSKLFVAIITNLKKNQIYQFHEGIHI